MKKQTYYTDVEAQNKMMQLFSEGKGLTALKDDPKCPPAVKKNLQKLEELHFEVMQQIMVEKGGQNEC